MRNQPSQGSAQLSPCRRLHHRLPSVAPTHTGAWRAPPGALCFARFRFTSTAYPLSPPPILCCSRHVDPTHTAVTQAWRPGGSSRERHRRCWQCGVGPGSVRAARMAEHSCNGQVASGRGCTLTRQSGRKACLSLAAGLNARHARRGSNTANTPHHMPCTILSNSAVLCSMRGRSAKSHSSAVSPHTPEPGGWSSGWPPPPPVGLQPLQGRWRPTLPQAD